MKKEKVLQLRMTAKTMMIALLLGIAGKMYAYDFSAVCSTGQRLYYNIIDATNHYVMLTSPYYNQGWSGYAKPTGDIMLPESVQNNGINYSVTSIGSYAFWLCNGLTGSLTIPNSVLEIGYMAFSGCSGFSGTLTIPNSVTSIDSWAFENCSGFTGGLTIPNSVTSIRGSAFRNCSGLETIVVEAGNPIYDSRENCNAVILTSTKLVLGCKNTVILNSITSIGPYAFSGCSGLTGNLTIPNTITLIDLAAFRDCIGLTSINIPNSVTTVGDEAFFGCIGLTSVVIPNSVTSIGSSTFSSCGNLSYATIGKSISFVGAWVFEGCSSLTNVNFLSEAPPTLVYGSYGFDFPTSNENFTIFVPYESLYAYKTATHWSNYSNYMLPLSYKSIPGYAESNNNWQFIASPLAESTAPTEIDDMISAESTYDLYRFDQTENAEWRNYKANNFTLTNGQGYLYANAEDVNLIFKGEFNEEETKEVGLTFDANATFAGWNLVGNPFPVSAYANKSYYVMNEEGTAIEPVAVSMETAIPACTGVMVKADAAGETVTFSKTAPEAAANQGVLQIAVAQANTRGNAVEDKVIVSFNANDHLEKFIFNKDNATLSIPQDGKDLAIAYADRVGEVPLNFKASSIGQYTLSINPENMEMDYLHLIDNMTGADVDLLTTPTYTFNAKTTDYATRFRLVFSASGDADGDNETFAYFRDGEIIIRADVCNASLQVVEVTGRVVVSRQGDAMNRVSTNGMVPGVYVLRLVDGNDVRTQKIVIP